MDLKNSKFSFTHYLCQASHSEKEAQRIFAASKETWYSSNIETRHEICYPRSCRDSCSQCHKQDDDANESYAQLSLAFLRCCRQMYQEACSAIFSKSTFSFTNSSDLVLFLLRSKSHIKVAIRSLHLDLIISDVVDEQTWNTAFPFMSKDLKSLQHIYINIDQRPKEVEHLTQWSFEQPAECSFLGCLRTLRHFKLKTVTIIISDRHILHGYRLSTVAELPYRWTMLQKQEWADYIRGVLLHERGQNPATGQAV